MKVGDILRKKTARVATVRMNETVGIAAQLMRASNISALVVKDVVRTEGNTAVGMFTERDVVRAIAEHGAAGVNLKVSQLISVQQLVSCSSTDTLEHVRHLMNENHIRHLPVIDNYSLIGVVSIRDISTAFDEEAIATVRSPLRPDTPAASSHRSGFEMSFRATPATCAEISRPRFEGRLMKICIYGAGAIGGYLGVQLARAGADVSLVARGAHLAAMRDQRPETPDRRRRTRGAAALHR